ncbi:magnesium transporter [Bauldia sp.]|uniref:magnesium transporter n=1 Tax=Bauldia sp. TaxID=2575872 RepID=UPI003BA8FD90
MPATRPAERGETYPVRNDRGDISLQFLALIRPALRRRDKERLTQLIKPLHEADVGDLLESLAADERSELVDLLGDDFDYMVLTELDQKVRARLLADLGPHAVADGLRKLESDDAVAVIDDLPPEEQRTVLDRMPLRDRIAVSRSLAYPDETAGRLMQREFVAVPPFWDVGRTIDYLRDDDDLPDDFYEIFVVDTRFHPIGTVALDKLLRRKRPMAINDIANHKVRSVRATEDQEAVARLFERYNLLSAPVIDDDGRLVGVITIDDVVDVIEAEAEEDIRRLAGVGRRESSEAIVSVARARIPWLLVNIATGFLAAAVIGLFDGTIEQMVALAILMPIVASMGGNAGTQAMTVTVRAIATRDIGSQRAHRVVGRELMVAVVNGSVVAVCVGAGAGLWFRDASIGIVIALALIITIFVAGLVGSFIPLILDRLKIDPAVASGVILTAITDVTGFFVFLALAGFWFGLL